ncbi:MAG: hypothetical protein WD382_03655 [Halofilum sp. (in: g-proteobacteria)]
MATSSNEAVAAGRRRLLLIVAVFAGPLLVASAWFAIAPETVPRGGMNGDLIEPAQPLEAFEAPRGNGESYTLDDLRGHWTMLHPVKSECGDRCRERLYDTRQIHDALNEDRIRVRRVAVASEGRATGGLASVLDEHPRLTVLTQPDGGELERQLPPTPAGTVLLIDPLGNLMMRFSPAAEPSGILDDLEHLLKASRVG